MTKITEGADLCTVIVTVDAEPAEMENLAAHASAGLEAFRSYPGFVSGALHVSQDGGRIVQYLQWATEADYRACVDDPSWDDRASTRRFMERVESGAARVDVRTYVVRRTAVTPSRSDSRSSG